MITTVETPGDQFRASKRLGELLRESGTISEAELDRGLTYQQAQGGRLGSILVRMGAISEESLYGALAQQLGLPMQDLEAIDATSLSAGFAAWSMSRDWWMRQEALPWCGPDGVRWIAAVDPLQSDLREAIEAHEFSVHWQMLMPTLYERLLGSLHTSVEAAHDLDARALRELAEDAPIIALVNNVLAQAVEARASDIHLEPGEHDFEVRLRIDGVLHTRMTMPMARFPAVASRVKLVSQLDIAERRLPQDGRTSIRVAGAEMDVRVSSIPAVHGESIVMRLLPKERADLRLDRLGMEADHLAKFSEWLSLPNGLVLVTGPTGSGKSTTLYGALAAVNDLSRKIITVEDPVEYRLAHVVQIQTQAEIGYTFARALRSILRHDPDIIMVGEIRDRETAEIAVQSALTGHLVLATLHTNDALSAVTRLVDMGVEPYLVAASLKAVMAQRLVRRLCPQCGIPADAEPTVLSRWADLKPRLGEPALRDAPAQWRQATGCAHCQQTGFRGRLGIYELVTLDAEMQHLIAGNAPLQQLVSRANTLGRRSLVQDGLLKVRNGLSTFEEVLRASGGASGE